MLPCALPFIHIKHSSNPAARPTPPLAHTRHVQRVAPDTTCQHDGPLLALMHLRVDYHPAKTRAAVGGPKQCRKIGLSCRGVIRGNSVRDGIGVKGLQQEVYAGPACEQGDGR
jgi:hypothetical protein